MHLCYSVVYLTEKDLFSLCRGGLVIPSPVLSSTSWIDMRMRVHSATMARLSPRMLCWGAMRSHQRLWQACWMTFAPGSSTAEDVSFIVLYTPRHADNMSDLQRDCNTSWHQTIGCEYSAEWLMHILITAERCSGKVWLCFICFVRLWSCCCDC